MEFLFLVTPLLVEAYKWVVGKFGATATKWSILLGVGIVSFVWTYLRTQNIITEEFLKEFLTYVAGSIATYELIIKWLFKEGIVVGANKILGK